MPGKVISLWSMVHGRKKTTISYQPPTTNPTGFTLIEILISISVMAVVFGAVITSSAKIQQNSRNAKRQADLRTIQSVLQQYYADQNYYPFSAVNGELLPTSLTSSYKSVDPPPAPVKTYMNTLPTDPNTQAAYCYKAKLNAGTITDCTVNNEATRCHSYKLYAVLEGVSGTTYTCGSGTNYNLVVTPN